MLIFKALSKVNSPNIVQWQHSQESHHLPHALSLPPSVVLRRDEWSTNRTPLHLTPVHPHRMLACRWRNMMRDMQGTKFKGVRKIRDFGVLPFHFERVSAGQ